MREFGEVTNFLSISLVFNNGKYLCFLGLSQVRSSQLLYVILIESLYPLGFLYE